MIKLTSLLFEEKVRKISLQTAIDNKYFGPIYHGTSFENQKLINQDGFKIFYGDSRTGNVLHGYQLSNYYAGMPAPVHHLGYGVYFTTVKNIAKQFNGGTLRGLKIYYADIPRLETINFGSHKTMMQWWIKNGYDYDTKSPEKLFGNPNTSLAAISAERYRATIAMTNYLKSKYDAVWFKGKSIRRLLDGDQVCIFNPDNIFEIDISLSKDMDIGSKVIASGNIYALDNETIIVPVGTKGIILKKSSVMNLNRSNATATTDFIYTVKFDKGGTQYNIIRDYIAPYTKK
jgi:hypothetical protein